MADLKRVISIQTEIKRDSIEKSERTINNFLNKYNDKSIKVNTDDLSIASQEIKSLKTEIEKIQSDGNLQHLLPTISQDKQYLEQLKEEFKEIKVIFTDGSIASGFEDTFTKLFQGAQIAVADLGDRANGAKKEIEDLWESLKTVGSPQKSWDNNFYLGGNFSQSELETRISLLQRLVETQNDLQLISGREMDGGEFASGFNVKQLINGLADYKANLQDMRQYEIETTRQLEKRRDILKSIQSPAWDNRTQLTAKGMFDDKEAFEERIASLKEYIEHQKSAINSLQQNEDMLFNGVDIDAYVTRAQQNITRYNTYLEELMRLKNGPQSLNEVINQLNELKNTIVEIKASLDPISEMFKNEGSAIKTMADNGTASFTTLSEAVNALYQNLIKVESAVNTISQKEFNFTNINTIGVDSKGIERQQISQYRSAVSQMYNQITSEMTDDLNSILTSKNGKDVDRGAASRIALQIQEIGAISQKDLGTTSIPKLQVLFEKLFDARNKLIADLEIAASSVGGKLDAGQYTNNFDSLRQLSIGDLQSQSDAAKNAAEQQKNLATETNDVTAANKEALEYFRQMAEALGKIKDAIDPLSVAFSTDGTLFNKMATGGIEALDPLIQRLKEVVSLTAQVATVSENHPAIDNGKYIVPDEGQVVMNLDAGTGDSSEKSAQSEKKEADALGEVAAEAKSAAIAKNEFVDANKKTNTSAEDSSASLKKEAEHLDGLADSAEKAAAAVGKADDQIDKREKVYVAGNDTPSKIVETATDTTDTSGQKTRITYMPSPENEGEWDEVTRNVTDDFKKVRDETEKTTLAVTKFKSAFREKTANNTDFFDDFFKLDKLDIKTLDDVKEAKRLMTELDAQFNNVTSNLRGGQSAFNPFVNAMRGIGDISSNMDAVTKSIIGLVNPSQQLSMLFDELERNAALIGSSSDIDAKTKAYAAWKKNLQDIVALIKEESTTEKNSSKLTLNKDRQTSLLLKQQEQWSKSGILTDDLRTKIDGMFNDLVKVSNGNELTEWKNKWAILKDEVLAAKYAIESAANADKEREKNKSDLEEQTGSKSYWDSVFKDSIAQMTNNKNPELDKLKEYLLSQSKQYEELDNLYKKQADSIATQMKLQTQLDSPFTSSPQKDVIQERLSAEKENEKEILKQIASYGDLQNAAKQTEIIEKARALAQKEITEKLLNQNANYGKSKFNTATRKYDDTMASYSAIDNGEASPEFVSAMDLYIRKYGELKDARQKFIDSPSLANDQTEKNKFNVIAQSVESARKKVQEYIDTLTILNQAQEDGTLLGKVGFDEYSQNGMLSQADSLKKYANELFKGRLQITGWSTDGSQMYGVLDKGRGVLESVTVALEKGTNTMFAYRGETKETGTVWNQFMVGVGRKAKEISTFLLGAGSIYRVIGEVRKGIQYVKDIDLALTELKKVTDETDETYAKFLQTASKTGAVIGSTVTDFTNATANFARLGYSISEATQLAEAANIYKNVGDGLDSVDQASESIISTMKAFGIEANNSMSIVDKFNAVGNSFSISSVGIGDALQKSASALYEAGNTIDESIGLITAAM